MVFVRCLSASTTAFVISSVVSYVPSFDARSFVRLPEARTASTAASIAAASSSKAKDVLSKLAADNIVARGFATFCPQYRVLNHESAHINVGRCLIN